MFELYLIHGRDDPAANLDDWGFQGPRLRGVIGIHETYRSTLVVIFESAAAADVAAQETGWEKWDEDRLTMPIEDDLIRCGESGAGALSYFGDWGLMLSEEHGRTAEATRNALRDAVRFVEGFEGDELQPSVSGPHGLLARLRAANAAAWGAGDPVGIVRPPVAPLDELAPDMRARLVNEMGFAIEATGGNCSALVSRSSGGGRVMITGPDGGHLPAPDSWMVGAYANDECEGLATFVADPQNAARQPLTIFEAAAAALTIIAEREGH